MSPSPAAPRPARSWAATSAADFRQHDTPPQLGRARGRPLGRPLLLEARNFAPRRPFVPFPIPGGPMKIREIMTPEVRVASPRDTIQRAAQMMEETDCGLLPVGE